MKRLFIFGLATLALACASNDVPEPTPDVAAGTSVEAAPTQLPDTASRLPELGMSGMGALLAAGAFNLVRRRYF